MNITLFRDLPTEHWLSMERYADALARELPKLGCEVESFVARRPLPHLGGAMNTVANYAWRSLVYPRAAAKHQRDLNHIIDHSYAHLLPALDASRTVVTCHDLAPLALNEGRGLGRKLWDDSFRAMLSAAHLIADSEFTHDEILRLSDYPADQISVVPLAVCAEFFESISQSQIDALGEHYHLAGRKIVLHVGTCAPRKNLEMILGALGELRNLNLFFVQVGGRFTTMQRTLIESLGLGERVLQISSVSEDELRAWYQLADAFVFPSTYEGFGLPLLEAMASGSPVLCAQTSSLPEVVGDAALLFEPKQAGPLVRALESVLTDPRLASDLRSRGHARARLFAWEKTAAAVCNVYERIG